jgi:hypothetical protein
VNRKIIWLLLVAIMLLSVIGVIETPASTKTTQPTQFITIGSGEAYNYNGIPFQVYHCGKVCGVGQYVLSTQSSLLHTLNVSNYGSIQRVHFLQMSGNASKYPNGYVTGTLVAHYMDGTSNSLDLVLGYNTAEWSYDRPENQGHIEHTKIPPAYSWSTSIHSKYTYLGHYFYSSIETGGKSVNYIELTPYPANVPNANVFAVTLETLNQPPVLKILDAKMVSPNELGIGISVKYPKSCQDNTPRSITLQATINGKPVTKTFDAVNQIKIDPGVEWSAPTVDTHGNVLPTTPLRINLADEGVPRFTDDVTFTLTGTASYQGGAVSTPSQLDVKILLPVVVLHGYIHPNGYPLPWYFGGNFFTYEKAYKPLTEFLQTKGGYNKNTEWGASDIAELQSHGYNTHRYVTLWDPEDYTVVGYTHPMLATPSVIQNDVDKILTDHVWKYSYASKVNFVCHSFGGLVARYYASVNPTSVNKVITVGTPHAGITRFYQEAFDKTIESRADAEKLLIIQSGANKGQQNVMSWFVPTYDCLVLPTNKPPVNPYFTNTFPDYIRPTNGVKYFSIYSTNHPTPVGVILEVNKAGTWYVVKDTYYATGDVTGDGYVLAGSSASFGDQYPRQVTNSPLKTRETHATLMIDPAVECQILKFLEK